MKDILTPTVSTVMRGAIALAASALLGIHPMPARAAACTADCDGDQGDVGSECSDSTGIGTLGTYVPLSPLVIAPVGLAGGKLRTCGSRPGTSTR